MDRPVDVQVVGVAPHRVPCRVKPRSGPERELYTVDGIVVLQSFFRWVAEAAPTYATEFISPAEPGRIRADVLQCLRSRAPLCSTPSSTPRRLSCMPHRLDARLAPHMVKEKERFTYFEG